MRRVVVLAEAAEDLEEARRFYDAQEPGVGDYCVTSLLADLESLVVHHGVNHCRQIGRACPANVRFWDWKLGPAKARYL